ncbi:MAG: VCBS repeat-containing protein [Planctomycetes bacterium]|nr:VCBS repeat-containing protein [Planctomycetota bacterium]
MAVGDGSSIQLLRQGPIDTFVSSAAINGEGGKILTSADVDLNGRLDLIVSGGSSTRVWLQQTNGSFVQAPAIPFASDRAVPIDLNGDALDDLMLFTASGSRVAIQINPGIFVENPVLATSGVFADDVIDVDGDGELDVGKAVGTTVQVRFGGR